MATKLTMADYKAMNVLSRERSMLLVNMFGGTRLVFGTANAASEITKVATAGHKIYSNSKKIAEGNTASLKTPGIKQATEAFIRDCADVENIQDVIEAIGSDVVADLIAEITPSSASSGAARSSPRPPRPSSRTAMPSTSTATTAVASASAIRSPLPIRSRPSSSATSPAIRSISPARPPPPAPRSPA